MMGSWWWSKKPKEEEKPKEKQYHPRVVQLIKEISLILKDPSIDLTMTWTDLFDKVNEKFLSISPPTDAIVLQNKLFELFVRNYFAWQGVKVD